jgi:hypothetical protein
MRQRANGDWMITYTGQIYWPGDPIPDEVHLEDIAHGLSMLCRYAGHTLHFYSVAEHSIHVSYMVPRELALEGLLHDASEAYLCDLIRPVKRHCPDYQRLEMKNALAIRERFSLPLLEHPLVAHADKNILLTEYRDLLPEIPSGFLWTWEGVLDPTVELKLWHPIIAEEKFLQRYKELTR